MDGPSIEHSDSDSGESWTLLESNPAIGDEAPDFAESNIESPVPEIHEKDEDTDGISIITDSDHESPSPYQMNYDNWMPPEIRPESEHKQYTVVNSPPSHINNNNDSLKDDDDFLGDNTGKHRIYVHRRNKRLSTVLNIIVLGSVITAAGVAIGHMWGAKNDCSIHTTPAVNKILSNLYKLQEENAYLRNKLKELSSFYQTQQKMPFKQNRCKKVFEESLNNKNVDVNILTKCVDDKNSRSDQLESHLVEPLYEKDFVADVNRLEHVYKENKGWLDGEITKRLKVEEEMWQNNINNYIKDDKKIVNKEATNKEKNETTKSEEINYIVSEDMTQNKLNTLNKVSYADSLKSVQPSKKAQKREISKAFENETDKYQNKKKIKSDNEKSSEYLASEEELKKDDRYIGTKNKQDKKKYSRQKSFKKQKRHNKYEQWEMKGGLIKDYDDLSFSSQETDLTSNNSEQVSLNSVKKLTNNNNNNNSERFTETDNIQANKSQKNKKEKLNKRDYRRQQQEDWYEKRVALRDEARKKLEQELFGEMVPNSARWYFKRMQKREQCRVKDNSTNRKISQKRNMNYKTKH